MKLKTFLKKLSRINIAYIQRTRYLKFYENLPIEENVIFLEPQHGKSVNGNIYYLMKELNKEEYVNYRIYVAIDKSKFKELKEFLGQKGLKNIMAVKIGTSKYYQILASAKYLMTDTSFATYFIKKEGQVILNTWHGTPFKTLGKKVKNEFDDIGNIQKNFVIADYLLYPNEYTMKHIVEDYMLENICSSKILLEGYPRNEVFFDEQIAQSIRKEQQIEGKQIFVYMPTWRGKVSQIEDEEQNEFMQSVLKKIDDSLKDNQLLYVNLHPFVEGNIHYEKFSKVRKFPKIYETYEFLSVADCLITDYSSVFYDFANTRKKVILYTYDEKKYFQDRGLYVSFDELPFPKIEKIEDLIQEMQLPKKYQDEEFLATYCQYDNKEASKRLCEKIIKGKENNIKQEVVPNNHKENILIYAGNLTANGITTSIVNLLNTVDTRKRNYYVTFNANQIKKSKEVLHKLPESVNYIAIKGKMNLSLGGKMMLMLYKMKLVSSSKYIEYMNKPLQYEIRRIYHDIMFDTVIQFNGYNYRQILLYEKFPCNTVIYVHNDMYNEATVKKNSRLEILKYAYEHYDKVALVTEDLIEPTKKITESASLYISNNIIDYKKIIANSQEEVVFDETTESNVSLEKLNEILKSPNKKFINIGRFSKEKGQERLIAAFERLWQEKKNIYLIIIGGYGKEYEKILNLAEKTACKDYIVIIKYVSNPYPILKQCDYFMLSSLYEGFGLVLAEADILQKPVVSTDIVGPRLFMKEHNGTLVENSENGVYEGLKSMLEEKVHPMGVDYEKYNQIAVKQFEKLLENKESK